MIYFQPCRLPPMSYCDSLRKLNMSSLLFDRRVNDLLALHRLYRGKTMLPLSFFATFRSNHRPGRGANECQLGSEPLFSGPGGNARAKFLTIRAKDDWNNLPSEILKVKSSKAARKIIENHLSQYKFDVPAGMT